ncbi:TraR/DksA C4-type zinc finger protein [Nitrincola iocasae]|uniref:TraR/DksA family transcriptional regulator n=1 Tax=Nitrincola iocasae TaxID=2614693 RepID=A0A5J6LBG4_9GAMM|nr:TraR/DksA C4-type zinc finger protein [Nitrincola iocasae]QEW05641.1 TraR/DksA family transcriptional regulator [Nitrincola iocasae]
MTDIVDHASEREQQQRDQALARRVVFEPMQDVFDGVVYCIDCGDQISQERLAAKPNAARCIHCQTTWERRNGN